MNKIFKELEALRSLGESLGDLEIDKDTMIPKFVLSGDKAKNYKIVEQALLELKAIKEANPSEALKCLGLLGDFEWHNKSLKEAFSDLFNTIEQALLKPQENEKIILGIEDYLNRRISIEPIEDVKKAFIEIRNHLQIIKEVAKR